MYLKELIKAEVYEAEGLLHIEDIDLINEQTGTEIMIWWVQPHWGLDWYPIIQIDDSEGNMVLHREGPENMELWINWINETLKDYEDPDEWWYRLEA